MWGRNVRKEPIHLAEQRATPESGAFAAVKPAAERRYAGRAVGLRAAERRERLLDAAFDLIGSRGYAETTVQVVCATAHVAPRDFYVHFTDREALLIAVLDERIARVLAIRMAPLVAIKLPDAGTHFRRRFEAIVDFYTEDPRRLRIQNIEAVGVSAKVEVHRQALGRRFQDQMIAELNLLVEQGLVPDHDWRLTVIALTGAVEAMLNAWVAGDRPLPIDGLIDEAERLYCVAFMVQTTKVPPPAKPH
jgi:AcrR family transcriptional regulator